MEKPRGQSSLGGSAREVRDIQFSN